MSRKKVNIKKIERGVARIKRALPAAVAIDALKHTKASFRNQGFTDTALEPWKPRKRQERGARRAILVKTGALRRSLGVGERSFNKVRVGSYGIAYATAHNWGVPSRNLPRRRFVGRSEVLNRQIKQRIKDLINKAWTP